MIKKKQILIFVSALLIAPNFAFALQMPSTMNDLAEVAGVSAKAYIVEDADTGEVLMAKNVDMAWPPASLTKLVTVLVVLDSSPNLNKTIAITKADQVAGFCNAGGMCLPTKAGIKYKLKDLLYAALIASDNNAANALSRSTGLAPGKFVEKMNQKAVSLGALQTHFNEPTGMDPSNYTTVRDYAKVVKAAFSNNDVAKIAQAASYSFSATNSKRYKHTVKSTNKLLSDDNLKTLGGKTGYLDESQYNFATEVADRNGQSFITVVFGSPNYRGIFEETKILSNLAAVSRVLAISNLPQILGASTTVNSLKN